MPQTSVFTPCGMLELSSRPSHAQAVYEQLQQLLDASPYVATQLFDLQQGEHLEAWVYATAMGLGRHLYWLEKAGNQVYPDRCLELLPLFELDYLLTPGPKDDYIARQNALAAAELLSQGYRIGNVIAGLRALLGADFYSYLPTPTAPSPYVWPSPTFGPPGNFVDVRVPQRFLQLVDPVAQTGSPIWCAYQNLDTTIPPVALVPGDVVVVGAGNTSQQEQITVSNVAYVPPPGSNATAIGAPAGAVTWSAGASFTVGQYVTPTSAGANGFFFRATTTGTTGTTEPVWPAQFGVQVLDGSVNWIAAGASTVFEATFTKSHDIGAPVVAGNFPYGWSTQRVAFVIVSAAAASDTPTRNKINAYMAKIARGPSLWAIVAGTPRLHTNGGNIGTINAGYPMGTQPLEGFVYTNS